MGCGASATAPGEEEEEESVEIGPDGEVMHEWWIAGEVSPGGTTRLGEQVPHLGPFDEREPSPVSQHAKSILFATTPIDKDGTVQSMKTVKYGQPIYARAFFSHGLPCYAVGWARLELSADRPHYNTRKIREREAKLAEQGKTPDYSKRRKFFLYPESIKEIGLFLTMNGKQISTECAVSKDSWDCDPIEDAFFTFTVDRGSVFGLHGAPENSLPIFLRPAESDKEHYNDERWCRFQIELIKALQKAGDGTHTITLEVRYRYGNWKFVAWNEADRASKNPPSYRYSDEERDEETSISTTVALGSFQLQLAKGSAKVLEKDLATLEEVLKGLAKKD